MSIQQYELSQAQKNILSEELKKLENLRPFKPGVFKYEHILNEEMSSEDLKDMAYTINSLFEYQYSSHRKLLGPFIVKTKYLIKWLFERFVRPFFSKQVSINHYNWRTALYVRDLQLRVRDLEQKLAKLEKNEK